jgi:hypothetical protein
MKIAKINYGNNVVELLDLISSQPADDLDYYYINVDSGLYGGSPEIGGNFDPTTGTFLPIIEKRVLNIISILMSNPEQATVSPSFDLVTCPVGTSLTFTCRLVDGSGNILPIDRDLIVPVYKMGNTNIIGQRLVKTKLIGGEIEITLLLPENGEWYVSERGINDGLSIEHKLTFRGVKMMVFD